MAAAMRRWVARMMPKRQPKSPFPPSIYPTLLEKVGGMKKDAPTEETAKVLGELEDKIKVYHTVWEANERQVQGVLRNRMVCRAFFAVTTIGTVAVLVKGVVYKMIEG